MIVSNNVNMSFTGRVGKNLKNMVKEGNSYDRENRKQNNAMLDLMDSFMKRNYSKNTVLDLVSDEKGSRIVLTNPVLNEISYKTNHPNKEVVVADMGKITNEDLRKAQIPQNLEDAFKALYAYNPHYVESELLDGMSVRAKEVVNILDRIYGGNNDKVYKNLKKEIENNGKAGLNELEKLNTIMKGNKPSAQDNKNIDIIF